MCAGSTPAIPAKKGRKYMPRLTIRDSPEALLPAVEERIGNTMWGRVTAESIFPYFRDYPIQNSYVRTNGFLTNGEIIHLHPHQVVSNTTDGHIVDLNKTFFRLITHHC